MSTVTGTNSPGRRRAHHGEAIPFRLTDDQARRVAALLSIRAGHTAGQAQPVTSSTSAARAVVTSTPTTARTAPSSSLGGVEP